MPTSVRSSILCGRGASGSASLASQSTMPTPRRPNHLAFSNGANMGALPYDINTNLPFIGMRSARLAFEDVAAGRRIMCLVCGMTGVGKTLEARRALRKAGVPFHEFGVTPSERDLVKLMWFITCGIITYRGRRILVVIADDQDGLARRETILNHLKGMFGSDRRRVTFPSSEALRNEEYKNSENAKDRANDRATIAPSGFDIDIRLIWLSNLDYTDPGIIATLPSHFHAMVSKGLDPLCIPNDAAHDGRDVFLFTHYLATEKNSLGGAGYSYEVARQAVRFYVENVHRLIDIPPRRLAMIAKVIKDNPDPAGRDERLAQMLRDTDQRPKLILPESWVPVLLWPTDPPHRAEAVPIVPPPEETPEPNRKRLPLNASSAKRRWVVIGTTFSSSRWPRPMPNAGSRYPTSDRHRISTPIHSICRCAHWRWTRPRPSRPSMTCRNGAAGLPTPTPCARRSSRRARGSVRLRCGMPPRSGGPDRLVSYHAP